MQLPSFPPQQTQASKSECTIHATQLHESITEEMLWKHFSSFGTILKTKIYRDSNLKSIGSGYVTYQNSSSAQQARLQTNFTYLLNKNFIKNQKRIIVSKEQQKEAFEKIKEFNLYLDEIPEDEDPHIIYNYLTQYGEIQSLNLPSNQKDGDKLAGFGYLLYENVESAKKLLEEKYIEMSGKKIQISKYKNPSQKSDLKNISNTIFIKNFSEKVFTEQEAQNEELLNQETKILKEELQKYGKIQSFKPQVNTNLQKVYAFASFENPEIVKKIISDHANSTNQVMKDFDINVYNKDYHDRTSDDDTLMLKNLRYYDDEEENLKFRNKVKEVIEKYGKISSFFLKKGKKPTDKVPDANMAFFKFYIPEHHYKFLCSYADDKEFCELFINSNANSYVTIWLPSKFKKQQKQFIREQKTQQLQDQQQQQMTMQLQVPFGSHQQYGRPMNRNYQNQPYGNTMRSQSYGYRQQQYQRQQQRPFTNKSVPPKPYVNQQQPNLQNITQETSQQNQQQNMAQQDAKAINLADLKNNLQKFIGLEKVKQGQILGNLIYPKVQAVVKEQNQPDNLSNKITGMLIDFEVFEVQDIIDILESPEELKERVTEAIELIKQQQ